MFKKTILIIVGFVFGAGSLVFAANVWQGTDTLQDGQIISSETISDNFDFLYTRTQALDSIPVCTGGDKTLGWDGSGWTCNDLDSATNGGYGMAFDAHTEAECVSAGGVVYDTGSTLICRFTVVDGGVQNDGFFNGGINTDNNTPATCPAGWNQYQFWTQTTNRSAGNFAYGSVCNTGSHVFSNLRVEQCTGMYCRDTNKGCGPARATAFVTSIGCY